RAVERGNAWSLWWGAVEQGRSSGSKRRCAWDLLGAPERVAEPDPGRAGLDPCVDRVEPRAQKLGLGVGELGARRAAIEEHRAPHAIRFLRGGEPAPGGALRGDRVVDSGDRLGDLEPHAVDELRAFREGPVGTRAQLLRRVELARRLADRP